VPVAAVKSETNAAVMIKITEGCLRFIFKFVPSQIFNLKMFSPQEIVKKGDAPAPVS
jgi:hypothetical protein